MAFRGAGRGLLVLIPQLYIIFCLWQDTRGACATHEKTERVQQQGGLD